MRREKVELVVKYWISGDEQTFTLQDVKFLHDSEYVRAPRKVPKWEEEVHGTR